MSAPVLVALLRRRLAELTGLPESELRALMPLGAPVERSRSAASERDQDAGRRGAAPSAKPGQRRAPSLVRELIQALLLQPELARSHELPTPADGSPEGVAFGALVAYCTACEYPLTTAGVMQHFARTAHEPVLASALATAEDHGITAEHAAEHLRAGVARYWQQAQRAGRPGAPPETPVTAEEAERLRQLEMVRRGAPHIR